MIRSIVSACLVLVLTAFIGSAGAYTEGGEPYHNSFFGSSSGNPNTSGYDNSFFGSAAGMVNSTGNWNSFFGSYAGYVNTMGNWNSFFGRDAGSTNNTGNDNSFFGCQAGKTNNGVENTFIGSGSGWHNSIGNWNTFLGFNSGYNNNGYANVFLGANAGSSETSSDKLYIDNCHVKDGSGNCTIPLIYGEFDNRIVKINGALFMTSDERLKQSIEPLQASLDKVMRLKGVSYEWKTAANERRGPRNSREIGLIAQEVEAVIPELVHTDSQGYKALSYDKIVPVLIEAVKELHKEIKEKETKYETLLEDKDARIERLEKALQTMERRMAVLESPSNTLALK
jgi:hypothetical protein